MVTINYLVVSHPALYVKCYRDVHRNKETSFSPSTNCIHTLWMVPNHKKIHCVSHIKFK